MKGLPYGRQWISEEDEEAVARALRSEWLTQGPEIEEFEAALADFVGARYAVAVSSGTAALHLACLALGLGPGDTAVTSPITFVASANAAVYCGARPVFSDIDPNTACLDPAVLERQLLAGLRPKVVLPVHYAGLPCDMEGLSLLAGRYGFALLEDACHALGATQRVQGRREKVGACGRSAAAVLSFHPVKHITTGEGGAVVTNDRHLADAVRR
ncbi:MAG: aminotransferase class I/II-fold pyridoxal phosphate-dependent enzyme, partial [Deltaproteobacteria bacterium]|nr:aminotransferase class I/II-fold pyridoxal phosphate-dependent enzyme [Deltaproteobacteria bacterium]